MNNKPELRRCIKTKDKGLNEFFELFRENKVKEGYVQLFKYDDEIQQIVDLEFNHVEHNIPNKALAIVHECVTFYFERNINYTLDLTEVDEFCWKDEDDSEEIPYHYRFVVKLENGNVFKMYFNYNE